MSYIKDGKHIPDLTLGKQEKCKRSLLQRWVSWLITTHEWMCKWPHVKIPYDPDKPILSGLIFGGFTIWLTTLIYMLIEAIAN